jgi:2-polyprenyl-6-methoxyphenol hydroxylase-like FAD-dependent oxidoreductase
MQILIVGGGIGGLAAALSLHAAGIDQQERPALEELVQCERLGDCAVTN